MANDLIEFIESNKRESIPISFFKEKAHQVKEGYIPRVDYLKVIDQIIGGI